MSGKGGGGDYSMNTMTLAGIRRMEMRQAPDPTLESDTDVLIRMTTVGVCGSDIHYFTEGRIGSQVIEFPFVLGHEGAGIVERVGSGVTRVRTGQRIRIEEQSSGLHGESFFQCHFN